MRFSKNMTKLGQQLCCFLATQYPQCGPKMPKGELRYQLRGGQFGIMTAICQLTFVDGHESQCSVLINMRGYHPVFRLDRD